MPPSLPLTPPLTPAPARAFTAIVAVIALCSGVELVLQGADHGLWGSVRWRGLVWAYGGFWSGLLQDWQPNFPGQGVLMFLTYSLVHTGFAHLLGNMLTLAALGQRLPDRMGAAGFLALYALSSLGAALGFALLDHGAAPMIGASGAVFGLAGALTLWDIQARPVPVWSPLVWRRLALILTGLVLLNLIPWALQGGNLAWQAHLGGFVTGFGLAALYPGLLAKIRS